MRNKNASILLAEDEESLRYVFEKQLKVLGYKSPDFAENGVIAVRKAKLNHYDLVFMDIRMPELDGISAAQRIREEASVDGRTPIIGLTAYAQKQLCVESGMDDFMQKPIMLYELEAMLTKWLRLEPVPSTMVLTELVPRMSTEKALHQSGTALNDIQQRINDLRRQSGLE